MKKYKLIVFLLITLISLTACDLSEGSENATPTKLSQLPTSTPLPPTPTLEPTPVPPTSTPTIIPTPTLTPTPDNHFYYIIQSGDTASSISKRFNVQWNEIVGIDGLSKSNFLEPGIGLYIPKYIEDFKEMPLLIPDVELLFSLTANNFNLYDLVDDYDGYLNSYTEWFINYGLLTGVDLLTNLSRDNSINPKIMLALLQYNGNWIEGQEISEEDLLYPMGIEDGLQHSLFNQVTLAVDKLVMGYYGWRDGSLTHLTFSDESTLLLDPNLNAGTVALMHYFSMDRTQAEWGEDLYGDDGFMNLYLGWYGDPWLDENSLVAHIPANLEQPDLILPFLRNQRWSYTGGPHGAWRAASPLAGLDFAPALGSPGCSAEPENQWVLASADGVIARKTLGVIVLDLDGDGNENTGWVLIYLHMNGTDHLEVGDFVEVTDKIGIPSCLGGRTTGIHIHVARKYNGEWMLADGPVSYNLGGWIAVNGDVPYEGLLLRDDEIVTAYESATEITYIKRLSDDP